MKTIINKILVGSLALAAATACTSDFENINSNPYEPGDLTPDDYAIGSAMNNMASTVMSGDVNTLQFTDCLLGGPLGGYFSDSNAGFTESIIRYNPKNDWSRVFLKSDKVIAQLYSNMTMIEAFAETSGDELPLGVAKVIKVATMHRVADTYGPIPYTKIGTDGNLATPYDSSPEVYKAFFDELDEALAILHAHAGDALSPSSDFTFRGDISKWIKFANSLKLRLAMRISNTTADRTLAKQMAEEAVADGVMTSNADNAAWDYFQTSTNPMYTAVNYNSGDNEYKTGGDTHAAADIICYMNGYNDPRREAYFLKSGWAGTEYIGLRRGWQTYANSWGFKFSGVNIKANDPLVWMNAAEVAFLRAEGSVLGFEMGGTAQSFYEEGIRLSFEQWGAGDASEYIADATSMPQAYSDPSNANQYNGSMSTITIAWDEAATLDQKVERIITQKWIANWLNGCESWCDIRRTGYPKLIPVAANMSGGVVNSDLGPQRMPYPQEEYTNNSANVTEAVNKYLGGIDNMAVTLWWAKK